MSSCIGISISKRIMRVQCCQWYSHKDSVFKLMKGTIFDDVRLFDQICPNFTKGLGKLEHPTGGIFNPAVSFVERSGIVPTSSL